MKHESTMLQAKIPKLGKLSRSPGYVSNTSNFLTCCCIKYRQLVMVMLIFVCDERVLGNLINGVVRSEHDII